MTFFKDSCCMYKIIILSILPKISCHAQHVSFHKTEMKDFFYEKKTDFLNFKHLLKLMFFIRKSNYMFYSTYLVSMIIETQYFFCLIAFNKSYIYIYIYNFLFLYSSIYSTLFHFLWSM